MSDMILMLILLIVIIAILNHVNQKKSRDENQAGSRAYTDRESVRGPSRYKDLYEDPGAAGPTRDPLNGKKLEWDDRTGSARIREAGNTYSRSTAGSSGTYNERKEVREAIAAGERALQSLHDAERKLQSARGWGMMDIMGGSLLSGAMKHERISEANRYINNAKRQLNTFRNELSDVRALDHLQIEIGDFLTFADFFFDGFIADIMVQSKLSDAKRQLQEAIAKVEAILNQLYAL